MFFLLKFITFVCLFGIFSWGLRLGLLKTKLQTGRWCGAILASSSVLSPQYTVANLENNAGFFVFFTIFFIVGFIVGFVYRAIKPWKEKIPKVQTENLATKVEVAKDKEYFVISGRVAVLGFALTFALITLIIFANKP